MERYRSTKGWRDSTREAVYVQPQNGEGLHSAHNIDRARKDGILVVELQSLQWGSNKGRRDCATKLIVSKSKILQAMHGAKELRYRTR